MLEILKHLFTGKDNETHDLVHYLAAIVILVGIVLQCYATIVQIAFSLQEYGIGSSSMLAGLGLSLKLKGDPASS